MARDTDRGIYKKYHVKKLKDPKGKHIYCDYFVLDWQHDPYTVPAALAYADACEAEFPQLAKELREKAKEAERFRPTNEPPNNK